MTTLLVTISLLLHGVTFLWIMTLLQKQQPNQATDIEKTKNEIEDLLISYTAEMKEENELLLKQIEQSKTRNKLSNQQAPLENDLVGGLEDKSKRQERSHTKNKPRVKLEHEVKVERKTDGGPLDYQPPFIEQEEEFVYEQSETAKVIALSKQGLSINEIAKKLSLGKGEVELMLKFYR
ncbi:DUF6115 domain-containing protein [Alkalihalobacillus deserti]|uniref:DUF6115 domain-containing protein n=1 Tax=Alkalihalobacillus deserti TaxID=2879466 RepID=UPI001D13B71F|nr:hypothetical protein [Alkalihalobacillus deserti]